MKIKFKGYDWTELFQLYPELGYCENTSHEKECELVIALADKIENTTDPNIINGIRLFVGALIKESAKIESECDLVLSNSDSVIEISKIANNTQFVKAVAENLQSLWT